MPSLSAGAYDRHRRVGQGDTEGREWRPRLGADIELFGTPVALGPQHALGLLAAGVLAGLEGVVAVVVIFFGWLLYKNQAAHVATDSGSAALGTARIRQPSQRLPGLWGAIMHFIGPVPEGPPIAMGEALQGTVAAAPVEGGAVTRPRPSPPPASKSWTDADEAKARAARSAAARAAAARAETRERAEHHLG